MRNSLLGPVSEKLTKQIVKSTCQFFYKNEKGWIKADGCGCCIKYKNSHYIVSAAHVIDIGISFLVFEDGIFYFGSDDQFYKTPLPSSRLREDDIYDIGIIKLSDASISELEKRLDFIEEDQIHITANPQIGTNYLLVGFPESKTDRTHSRDHIVSKTMSLFTTSAEKHSKIPSQYDYHIFIDYNKDEVFEFKKYYSQLGPKPKGVSGCGLWKLFPNSIEEIMEGSLSGAAINYKLAGIIIENKYGFKQIIATNIKLAIDQIKFIDS